MAADDAGLVSYASHPDDGILQLVYISVLIVVGVLIMFLMHVLGSLRRRTSHKVLHAIVLGAYTVSYALVSYTLGLMQESEYYFHEFPVWAVCLLMLLGGTDNLMACKLDDVDNWKSFHVKHLLKGALVVYIVAYYSQDVPEYQKPLWAILSVNVLQSCVRIKSMRMASKSNLLSENVKPIVDHMKRLVDHMKSNNEEEPSEEFNLETMKGYNYVVSGERGKKEMDDTKIHNKPSDFDVKTMKGYNYVVSGECGKKEVMDDKNITTVDQIWQSGGRLLHSDSDSDRGMQLRDICLSMALSKMLNRRFAGFKLAEAGLPRTRDFVFKGLLDMDEKNKLLPGDEKNELLAGDDKYERAFRVIEVELGFVYDLYYTRYPFLYHKVRHFALCLPVAMVIFCSWLTYVLFNHHEEEVKSHVPLDITLFLMAVVTFLEAFQLYLHIASDWFKVALIRSYVRRPERLQTSFPEKVISLSLRLKAHRPWEKKLGQYSLLQSYNRTCRKSTCIHYATLFLVDNAKKGRKREKLVKLSAQVKQAVIHSLIKSDGKLKNGTRSLEKNGVHGLSWACAASEEKVIDSILVWHVATTICKHQLDAELPKKHGNKVSSAVDTAEHSVPDSSWVDTASSLSQYCAYLVAFAPDLLPGHSFDSASILDKAIEDARLVPGLQHAKTMETKCQLLLDKASIDPQASKTMEKKSLILDKAIEDTGKLPDLLQAAKAMEEKCQILDKAIEDTGKLPDLEAAETTEEPLVLQGARLAKVLTKKIPDENLRWKVLSDFWAEMTLYVAPCDNAQARAHLEALARGGEFITHLWALLTHAGVLGRDQVFEVEPMDAV